MTVTNYLYTHATATQDMGWQYAGGPISTMPPWVKAVVESVSNGIAHVHTSEQGTEACLPGSWIVRTNAGLVLVKSNAAFREAYVVA